ncbi:hypothetical protein BDW42DRAFT_191988 [Aspergillus taichungensis]|uniref:Uncharacterized protein n=1 Tax=Aspergillus taichungensis TaxID=482145 RepID=A0A2J5I1R8_9EURO|nr:hypothetical protein BDW42DRAFT_191988 [Aspergillus taichungensis]
MKPQSRNKTAHTFSPPPPPPAASTTSKDYFSHIPEQRTSSPRTTSHNSQTDHLVERPYLTTTSSNSSTHSSTWLQRAISQSWLSDRPLSEESRSALKEYEELFRPALESRRDGSSSRDRLRDCDRDRHFWGRTP